MSDIDPSAPVVVISCQTAETYDGVYSDMAALVVQVKADDALAELAALQDYIDSRNPTPPDGEGLVADEAPAEDLVVAKDGDKA